MVSIKELFSNEKKVREIYSTTFTDLVKELNSDDLSDEERRYIYDAICKCQTSRNAWEEEASNYWFRIGRLKGMSIGVFLGAACFATGQVIGTYIRSKIEA